MNPPDFELITRVVRHDDRTAFGELVQRHQSVVRRFLRQLTGGNGAWADDLAQDTFVQAYRSLARFRGDATFTTWLLGIAHNHFRNSRRRQRATTELAVLDRTHDDAPSPADSAALAHDLAAALRQLTRDEQTALHLFYRQGLTHAEIADVLGCPLGTVKTNLSRGKDRLRQLMAIWNPQT